MPTRRSTFVLCLCSLILATGSAACGSEQQVYPGESDTWIQFAHDVHGVRKLSLHVSPTGDYQAYNVVLTEGEPEPRSAEGSFGDEDTELLQELMSEERFAIYRAEANSSSECQAASAHYRVRWKEPPSLHSVCWVDRQLASPETAHLLATLAELSEQLLCE